MFFRKVLHVFLRRAAEESAARRGTAKKEAAEQPSWLSAARRDAQSR